MATIRLTPAAEGDNEPTAVKFTGDVEFTVEDEVGHTLVTVKHDGIEEVFIDPIAASYSEQDDAARRES